MLRLFTPTASDLNRGLWRVPMFSPPIRPDMLPEDLASLHGVGSTEIFMRITPAQVTTLGKALQATFVDLPLKGIKGTLNHGNSYSHFSKPVLIVPATHPPKGMLPSDSHLCTFNVFCRSSTYTINFQSTQTPPRCSTSTPLVYSAPISSEQRLHPSKHSIKGIRGGQPQ